MKKITILIPAYNEEESLPFLYEKLSSVAFGLSNYEWEFLFINDGSKDNTLEQLQNLRANDKRVNYVDLSRNFGKEIAMLAGFDFATGDCMIILDADLQDPPELIPTMIKYWEEGYDDVYAKRRTREGESFMKKFTSKLYYSVLQKMTSIPIQRDTGDFRLLDRKCIEALKQIRESQRYTKGMFSWIGFNKKELLFDRAPRVAGTTKWNYWKLCNLAIEGITSFTITPLRVASVMGIIVSLIAFTYMFVTVLRTLIWGNPVAGYPSLMAVMLFLGGIQLLFLGIQGEYLGRIFNETKNRPAYFVASINKEKEENLNK
ncbi:MAG: glycosyltransferase family 2 protein [Rikenellaceae bacterium]|nr:glycosyltransferase family 2 protein [Rikenellaceae bacterium]